MARVRINDDSRELTITVADDAKITPSLRAVYDGLPPDVVRDIEMRRVSVMYATVVHLTKVRDLLEPYPGKFRAWCDACSFAYDGVRGAIRRYEMRLLQRGETQTVDGHRIAPYNKKKTGGWASWGLRKIMVAPPLEWEDIFRTGYTSEWLRRAILDGNPVDVRERCARLAALLLEAAYIHAVDGKVSNGDG